MAIGPPAHIAPGGLTDDELLATGAQLETQLSDLLTRLEALLPAIVVERRKIRKASVKLGIDAAIALTGVVLVPMTIGVSLLLTVVGAGRIVWDGVDYRSDYADYRADRARMQNFRDQINEIESWIIEIEAEMDARAGR